MDLYPSGPLAPPSGPSSVHPGPASAAASTAKAIHVSYHPALVHLSYELVALLRTEITKQAGAMLTFQTSTQLLCTPTFTAEARICGAYSASHHLYPSCTACAEFVCTSPLHAGLYILQTTYLWLRVNDADRSPSSFYINVFRHRRLPPCPFTPQRLRTAISDSILHSPSYAETILFS